MNTKPTNNKVDRHSKSRCRLLIHIFWLPDLCYHSSINVGLVMQNPVQNSAGSSPVCLFVFNRDVNHCVYLFDYTLSPILSVVAQKLPASFGEDFTSLKCSNMSHLIHILGHFIFTYKNHSSHLSRSQHHRQRELSSTHGRRLVLPSFLVKLPWMTETLPESQPLTYNISAFQLYFKPWQDHWI